MLVAIMVIGIFDYTEKEVAVRLFSSLGSRQGSRRPRSRSLGYLSMDRPPSRKPVPPSVPPPPRPSVSAMGYVKYHYLLLLR